MSFLYGVYVGGDYAKHEEGSVGASTIVDKLYMALLIPCGMEIDEGKFYDGHSRR